MKKIISLLMLFVISFTFLVGCSSSSNNEDTSTNEEVLNTESSSGEIEIALIIDGDTVDDKSFNQGIYEGIGEFATPNDISYNYYKVNDNSEESLIQSIELAIRGGAKTVICSSYLFEVPVYTLQDQYPDVNFIVVDGVPSDEDGNQIVSSNSVGVLFKEEEAGFLAGYSIVKEGYRNLGFMGGLALPSVVRFGYGFAQGIEYAAQELGLSNGDINLKYTYVGNFSATPENAALAASWYNEGTEVIFACGGNMNNSVIKSAEAANAKVIGVDVDQSYESETVITSAMKNLKNSVYSLLESIYNGTFEGGNIINLGCSTNDVILPMETSRFEVFTQEDYDAIYSKIVNSEVEILDDSNVDGLEDLNLSIVNFNVY